MRRGDEAAELSLPARGSERIEQTDLHIGVRRQAEQQLVGAAGVQVIQQQPHAHAAPGCVAQGTQHPAPAGVVGQVVVLNIQRRLGALHELHAVRS